MLKVTFAAPTPPKSAALVAGVMSGKSLSPAAQSLDEQTGGAISRALKASRFDGNIGQSLELLAPPGIENSRILLVGMGDPAKLTAKEIADIGGNLAGHLLNSGEKEAAVLIDDVKGAMKASQRAAHSAFGAVLRAYRFDKYRTRETADKKPSLQKLSYHVKDAAGARNLFKSLQGVAEGIATARDVISEPANIIYPKSFVAEAKKLEKLGIGIKVLGQKEMEKLNMGALLGVAQGSRREPQLLVLEWMGGKSGEKPLAICGKGVCFDTGGISIKPAAGMEDMKWDMGGAGVTLGLMEALARRKAKANVVGLCGLVENMPDGNAQRPGDIVTSASGQTIEVLNTDAEGRLVLADVLWYAQKTYDPRLIVDLATLTGAIMVALGTQHAGLFSNDDTLSEQLTGAGKAVGEPIWRLPMGEDYDRLIDSDAADMKNIGNRFGGSITAAQFLQRFVDKDRPWAHLDIAGVTWSEKGKPTAPKGATGFGVRLLNSFIEDNFEK